MSDSPARLPRRAFVRALGAALVVPPFVGRAREPETLYNGIVLPAPWPPANRVHATAPQTPPYLADPPGVIPIDVGRQLFVDDFLVEESSLNRTFHRADYHPASPVLTPAMPWELRDEYADRTGTAPNPAAMVFSDGVFHDPADGLYKMWYMGGYLQNCCVAYSRDGLRWERPSLDVVPGTNIVVAQHRDSSTVWLDHEAADPAARYKMAFWYASAGRMVLATSPDGVHWRQVGMTGPTGDRSTMFYNPFRKVWGFSVRDTSLAGPGRFRRYYETPAFGAASWEAGSLPIWAEADRRDARRPGYDVPVEIYNLDCVAYESVLLGLFTMFRGERPDREKPNDICLGFSRDGFHWARPSREPFLGVSEEPGAWNWANVQSAGGGCLVVGDRLYFYVSGRQGQAGTNRPGVCSTGLATLRRDGFASVTDAPAPGTPRRAAPRGATLTTRPLRFAGGHLFVNAAAAGAIRVEVLDRAGHVIAPFSADRCVPVRGDGTRLPVTWTGAPSLASLAGEPVRFRFRMSEARLYAFWVSRRPDGASGGYVAAGGPGFRDGRDG